MANASGIYWYTSSPGKMALEIENARDHVLKGLFLIGQYWAARIEAWGKDHAPWTDRTTNARQGLRAFAAWVGAQVVIYFVHSVFYGVFLELKGYAVIQPALEAHYGDIAASLRSLAGGR